MRDSRSRSLVKFLGHAIVAPITVPMLALVALSQRRRTHRRRRRGERPRVLWGPQPIIVIRDWSKALQARGYVSHTFVNNIFAIHTRNDFDRCRQDRYWPKSEFDSLKAYPAMAEALVGYDFFHFFFDGGLLGDTPLWWIEPWLLKLAGKTFVMSAYGMDIAVPGYLASLEDVMIADFPMVVTRASRVRRKVDHFSRTADLIIETLQVGYLPRSDFLWINQFAVDTRLYQPRQHNRSVDDKGIVVLHAPSHRILKGTPTLISAVEQLREEGVNCQLQIIERVPNEELRSKVLEADIVVDQLILGFGYFALESLCLGKPVISNIGWMSPRLRSTPSMQACPMLDANSETIGEVLRSLIEDGQQRRSAGAAGREWIHQYHSVEAIGAIWDGVIRHVWDDTPLPSTGPSVAE